MNQLQRVWRRWWWALALVVLLGGYWLLPISGQVVVVPGDEAGALLWPRMELDPPAPQPGQEVTLRVTDAVAWTHVLLTVDGRPAQSQRWPIGPEDALVWEWTFVVPADGSSTLVFYRDCDTGCVERGRRVIGPERPAPPPHLLPTKLGVVFPNLERDWHGRSGWAVELTYRSALRGGVLGHRRPGRACPSGHESGITRAGARRLSPGPKPPSGGRLPGPDRIPPVSGAVGAGRPAAGRLRLHHRQRV